MSPEGLFSLAGQGVLPCWIALVAALFVPPLRPAARWAARYGAPGLLGLAYVALMVGFGRDADGGFGSLAAVARLFDSEWVLLAGWLHFLAFDLFVGAWIVEDTLESSLPRPVALLSLPLCFLAGPAGLLVHLLARASLRALGGRRALA